MSYPKPHVVEPQTSHEYTIISLHGRSSEGEEFAEEFFEGVTTSGKTLLQEEHLKGCKWVFPTACERLATVFQEMQTDWFDIYSLTTTDAEEHTQLEGLRQSVQHLRTVIEEELKYVSADKLILGGMSMGCATAIHALLSNEHKLGGFMGFCGWLPLSSHLQSLPASSAESLQSMYSRLLSIQGPNGSDAFRTPVFMSHSCDDDVVEIEHGRAARDSLNRLGMQVDFHEFTEGEHWIVEGAGYDAISNFLETMFTKKMAITASTA